mmetsp:Transcript_40647/g.61966  ORF Transcript_40647/g.61966 Transcript_40647/m.61966 type:complete len:201 (+) Transcript_40647:384-986(+)
MASLVLSNFSCVRRSFSLSWRFSSSSWSIFSRSLRYLLLKSSLLSACASCRWMSSLISGVLSRSSLVSSRFWLPSSLPLRPFSFSSFLRSVSFFCSSRLSFSRCRYSVPSLSSSILMLRCWCCTCICSISSLYWFASLISACRSAIAMYSACVFSRSSLILASSPAFVSRYSWTCFRSRAWRSEARSPKALPLSIFMVFS